MMRTVRSPSIDNQRGAVNFKITILGLLLVSGIACADTTYFAMPPPPKGALQTAVGDRTLYSGVIYLLSATDTLLLKPLGFHRFEFEGRSVNSVRYHALWPASTLRDSLPSMVSGVEYDMDASPIPETSPDLELPGQPDATPDSDSEPQPNPKPEGNE